jgi:hypothetical protein
MQRREFSFAMAFRQVPSIVLDRIACILRLPVIALNASVKNLMGQSIFICFN